MVPKFKNTIQCNSEFQPLRMFKVSALTLMHDFATTCFIRMSMVIKNSALTQTHTKPKDYEVTFVVPKDELLAKRHSSC